MIYRNFALLLSIFLMDGSNAFLSPTKSSRFPVQLKADSVATDDDSNVATAGEDKATEDSNEKRRLAKAALFGLIGNESRSGNEDPILADPITKEPLRLSTTGTILGGQGSSSGIKVLLKSDDNVYTGRTNSYYNLLRRSDDEEVPEENSSNESTVANAINSLRVFIPPPLRPVISSVLPGDDVYIPMRDLFTSPSVSFAYERGWRQGFASAGFPGADKEYEMVKDYFMPLNPDTVVDMSCATGLFTRRLAKGNDYERVIGCDYSEAMLLEARNRINSDPDLSSRSSMTKTNLDLVRCDVGDLPMQVESVDALHAGAAMHCWPDLDSAFTEIHRVLKPGGRFFASTFLAPYFRTVQAVGGDGNIEQQAFQYFETTEQLKDIVMKGGFDESKIEIEVLGSACAIIRAEK